MNLRVKYLRELEKDLYTTQIDAKLSNMDEHFISELNHLLSVVKHHIEEELKCLAQP